MFNRILVLFLAVVALGSNAFASRATTAVMGTGDAGTILNGGSFFYDDAYNIFYNPSYVNDFKNWAIIEKAAAYGNTGAQGGVFSSIGQFNLGLFFNRGDAIVNSTGIATAGSTNTLGYSQASYASGNAPIRPVELYIGTDAGMAKVGLGLTYASNSAVGGNSSYVEASLGAEIMGFDPFASGTITSKDDTSQQQHKFYRIGTKYKFGEWTPYVAFVYVGNPLNTAVPLTATSSNTERNFIIGLGRSTKLTDAVRMNYAISGIRSSDTGNGLSNSRYIVPIDLSFEGDALSWMTLRAGLNYHLIDKYAGANNTSATAATTGRIGATAHAGKADFEFAVGSTNGAENIDGKTFDFADGLFSEANLTYHF
jgi:hypothetical protein